jgi:hypothetical protein
MSADIRRPIRHGRGGWDLCVGVEHRGPLSIQDRDVETLIQAG